MTFMSNLAANPSGGIANQPAPQDTLGIINNLKDREMQDFKNKAGFMADLSIKQDRLRKIYGLDGGQEQQQDLGHPIPGGVNSQQQTQQQPMGGPPVRDPNQMSRYESGELGIKQQQLGLEQAKLTQQGQLGDQRLGIQQQQADLKQQTSDQIFQTKQADMQRKIEEANGKLTLAQQKLKQSGDSLDKQIAAHKELASAVEERHKLELQQKDDQFQATKAQHQQQIDALSKKNKDAQNIKTTQKVSADGSTKTTTKQTGDATDMVNVKGKDGKTYAIPKDKLDDWNANHAPEDDSSSSGDDSGSSNTGATE